MIRNNCFLLFVTIYFYLVVAGTSISTTNFSGKQEDNSASSKSRNLEANLNGPTTVSISSSSDFIYTGDGTEKLVGLGESSVITVNYVVTDSTSNSLSFSSFKDITQLDNVYLDFYLDDQRSVKTSPPIFTDCGMLGNFAGTVNNVQFRFHFSFTVQCSTENSGIIAESFKSNSVIQSLLVSFTDSKNPITITFNPSKGDDKQKSSLIVGKIDSCTIEGIAIVGDNLVLQKSQDSKSYYFGIVSGEQTTGTAKNITVDLLEFLIYDNIKVGGIFYKGLSLSGSFLLVRNRFYFGVEGDSAGFTTSYFAGLVYDFSGSELAYNYVYLKIDTMAGTDKSISNFFGMVSTFTSIKVTSCQIYFYAYEEKIYNSYTQHFYIGGVGTINYITNSYVHIDPLKYPIYTLKASANMPSRAIMKEMYTTERDSIDSNLETIYVDGVTPNYQTGKLNEKDFVYFTLSLYPTDNGIQVPSDFDNDKNKAIVYQYYSDSRIPTVVIMRRTSTLPEEIIYTPNENRESTITIRLLQTPSANVKVGIVCDSFLQGGGCNTYLDLNSNSLINQAYVQLIYQSLPFWKTCVTFNVTSDDTSFNNFQIDPVCYYVSNGDESVTLPPTGVECTEGARCQFNVPANHWIINFDVTLKGVKIYEKTSVTTHGGRLYVDFTYPKNDIDEGDKYVVTLKTTWYHLSDSGATDTDVTITNINKAGIKTTYTPVSNGGGSSSTTISEIVGNLKIQLETTPMNPVALIINCGTLECDNSNIQLNDKTENILPIKRGYLTNYDYNNDETTFILSGSVSSLDVQYNALSFENIEVTVKNDKKAELTASLQNLPLTCSSNAHQVSIFYGRIPQKDIVITITPVNKNLVVDPSEFTLSSEKESQSLMVTNLAACRENITEILTLTVKTDDSLYSSDQLSKDTITVKSIVYDNEIDTSPAPTITVLKLKDNSNEILEVIFDKIIFIDKKKEDSDEVDCNVIIKETDVTTYGLKECKSVSESQLEIKFTSGITSGSSKITFNKDVIRSSSNSINAMSETSKVVSDRTPVPKLKSSIFSDDGSLITVTFDRDIFGITTTNQDCSNVFSNNNLGEGCECRKSETKQIVIQLGNSNTIEPQDELTLKSDNTITSSEGHINHASGKIKVDYPKNPPTVKAIISGGNVVKECGGVLILNGLSSTGSQGRPFTYDWTYSGQTNSDISDAIDAANEKNDGYLTIIGNSNIPKKFSLSLTVYSYLNRNPNTVQIEITKDTSDRSIEVSIDGQYENSYKKDQSIDITGKGVLKTCSESITSGLTYTWSGINDNTQEVIKMDNFTTGNVKTISIEAGELQIGDYIFTLTVTDGELESNSSVLIHIIPRDLVIVLNGASNRNIPVTNPVELDISSSYDPDNYENNLIYSWKCEMNNHEKCTNSDGSYLVLDSISVVTIPANTLKAKNVYIFTGTITGDITFRTASTSVTVNVLEENIDLTVEIIAINPTPGNIYPHDYMLQLYGEVIGNYSPLTYQWIYVDDESLNIFKPSVDGLTSKEVTVDCSKMLSGVHKVMFKVFYKDYVFTSVFEFTVYMPPYGGFIVKNKNDIKFGEKITITTSGWISTTSLKYRFAVKIGDKISYLSDYISSNSYEGILPIGLASNEYKLTLLVYALDTYNGLGRTNHDSQNNEVEIISKGPTNSEEIKNAIDKLTNSSDHDQIFVVIDGITNDLLKNCVNDTDCLNDGKCKNRKCKCADDFIGDNCETHKPVDCVLSKEYEYGEYSANCGLVEREKWHKIKTPAQYGGKECEIVKEKEVKVLGVCTENIDGGWSRWSDWSDCDAKCEIYNSRYLVGNTYRNRNCNNPLPSGNGKYCEGDNIEYKKCIVSCPAPPKPCPGQFINSTGQLEGEICGGSERGYCSKTKTECKAYEPGCYSYCVCINGWTGKECNYREEDIKDTSATNTLLLNTYKSSLNKIHNSAEIHSTLSSSLKKLSDSYSILEDDDKNSLLELITTSVNKVGESKSTSLPIDALKQYIEATSTLLEYEGLKKVQSPESKSRMLEENGKNIKNIIENIGEIYNKNPSSESLNINTDGISVTCQTLDNTDNTYQKLPVESTTSSSPSSTVVKDTSIGSADLTLMDNHGCKSVELVEWNTIPSTIVDDKLVSGMVTINLHDDKGKKNIESSNEPIFFRQKINNPNSMKDVQCSYVDENTGELVTEGVFVYYIEKVDDGSVFVTCGTMHLSSFSIKTSNIIPKMNIVNPISDAKLLLNYSVENALVPIILGSVLLICIISWSYTKYKDSQELSIVTQEKANKFLSVGLLDEGGKKNQTLNSKDMSLVKNFALRMKSDHSWLAPALREVDEIVVINRSQRILCLTCQVLTSTAINALFFGINAENVAQLISTSIISTLCMLPCTLLVPWLYKYANGCTSKTISNKRKWWRLKSLKNRFRSYFSSGITSPELKRLKIGLLSTSSIYLVISFIFFIVSLIVMPFGAPSLLITACLIVLILETIFSLIATNITERPPFIFLFIVDLFIFIIDVIFLVLCSTLSNGSTSMTYNMWKAMHKNVAFKEFDIYIENNLNCCGFKDIDDYNIQDCLNPDLLANGFEARGCEMPLIDTFKKYGAFWGIFFVLSIIFMLVKCFVNLNYIFVNYNKVIEDNLGDFNSEITQKAGQKIITLLRHTVLKNKMRRKKEYVEWLRQRRMRSIITVCVNTTVFIYILIMVYINLLYGVKFATQQANSWIISSAISMAIDVCIQQPALILLNSVAASTMGAVLNFAA